jgi:hypothetical protein
MIERIDLGVRVAGDKALKADEFVTLSQLSGASTLPNGDIDFTTGSITRYEIIGDAVTTVFTLTHELGKDIIHEAYLDATGETVMLGLFLRTSDTDITIDTSPFILKVAEKLIVLVASALGGNETGGGALPDGTEGQTLRYNASNALESNSILSITDNSNIEAVEVNTYKQSLDGTKQVQAEIQVVAQGGGAYDEWYGAQYGYVNLIASSTTDDSAEQIQMYSKNFGDPPFEGKIIIDTHNLLIWLKDSSPSAGKVLRCANSEGKAEWADISDSLLPAGTVPNSTLHWNGTSYEEFVDILTYKTLSSGDNRVFLDVLSDSNTYRIRHWLLDWAASLQITNLSSPSEGIDLTVASGNTGIILKRSGTIVNLNARTLSSPGGVWLSFENDGYKFYSTIEGTIMSDSLTANTVLMANASKEIVSASGATGTFTTADSKTVTVTNGLITSIV